jgi:hypothetical protein
MSSLPDDFYTCERRFGDIAIEKGFITSNDLTEALNIQVQEEIECRDRRLIGQILLGRDNMTVGQIKRVLAELIGE